jgi:hypothetical protein
MQPDSTCSRRVGPGHLAEFAAAVAALLAGQTHQDRSWVRAYCCHGDSRRAPIHGTFDVISVTGRAGTSPLHESRLEGRRPAAGSGSSLVVATPPSCASPPGMPTSSGSVAWAAPCPTGTTTRSAGHTRICAASCNWSAGKAALAGTGPVIESLVQAVTVTSDRAASIPEIDDRIAGASAADFASAPFLLIGSYEQMAAQLLAQADEYGITSYVVREPAIPHMEPGLAPLAWPGPILLK